MKKKINPENMYQKFSNLLIENEKKIFQETPEEVTKVHLRPNKDIAPSLFKPDPLIPGGWIAHPTTIRAVRKEIFLAGEEFLELEIPYTCESCKKNLDLQFWHFCPFCEGSLPENWDTITNKNS